VSHKHGRSQLGGAPATPLLVPCYGFSVPAYVLDVGPRSRAAARFIARVRSEILTAIVENRRATAVNQQAVAERLGKKRSEINRQLTGEAPLTLRSVAELSWVLGREISFELRKPVENPGQNLNVEMTTVEWKKPTVIAARNDVTARNGQNGDPPA
jgi:hypothetical protein